jgi:serine/threonine protein kinase
MINHFEDLLLNCKFDRCYKLLENNPDVWKESIWKINSDKQNDILFYILDNWNDTNNNNKNENNFKKYSINEFGEFEFIIKGEYGSIYSTKNQNGEKVIIKKYNKEKNINDDFIRELNFIKKINEVYPNTCVELLGYIIDENDIYYLIMEKLYINLEDMFDIIKYLDVVKKEKLLNKWNNKIIELLYNINRLGIIHNDLKSCNIMFDYYGNIKLIDFGVSEFIGYGQINDIYSNYICTEYIKSPDNIFKFCYVEMDDDDYSIFEINRKNYSSDIYSLGCLLLECIYYIKDFKYKFRIFSNEIYMINKNNRYIKLNNNIINSYSEEFKNKIIDYLNNNSLYRKTAKNIYLNYKNKEINKENSIIQYRDKKNYFSNYYYYSNIELNNELNELIYIEEIYENYKNNKYKNSNTIEFINYMNNFLDYLLKYKVSSLDVLFNTLFEINNNYNESNYIHYNYYYYYSCIFDYKIEIENVKTKIINYNYAPVCIIINYYLIILQKNNILTKKIMVIQKEIVSLFLKWIININDNIEYTIDYIIRNIFEHCLNKYKIEINYQKENDNFENIEMLNSINNSEIFNIFFHQ